MTGACEGDGAGISATGGGNIFYKITPGLTGTLDLQSRFLRRAARRAPGEHHAVLAVLSRDARLLSPGRRRISSSAAVRSGARPYDRQSNNARPFFSRNIGLVNGRPVSLIAGGKLSGEYGGFDIGALSVLTDETPTRRARCCRSRASTRRCSRSRKVGFIFTNGDPTGQHAQYRRRRRLPVSRRHDFGGKIVQADFYL